VTIPLAWDLRRVTCSHCCTFTLQVNYMAS